MEGHTRAAAPQFPYLRVVQWPRFTRAMAACARASAAWSRWVADELSAELAPGAGVANFICGALPCFFFAGAGSPNDCAAKVRRHARRYFMGSSRLDIPRAGAAEDDGLPTPDTQLE